MRSNRKRFALFGVLTVMASMFVPSQSASANHNATLEIQVGAFLEGAPAESMKFFPDDLTVHKGDTLKFVGEFHTATMLPTSVTDLDAWVADNATDLGDPYHLIQNNPDNTPLPWKLAGDDPFFPRADCGSPDNPCSYDGGSVQDSGLLFNYATFPDPQGPPVFTGFNVTVDANPGDVFWVFCRVHPHMAMMVTVAGPQDDSTSQEDIDAAAADTIEEDSAAASALHSSLLNMRESRPGPRGSRVWQAYAGFDTEDFSLFGMYPRRLKIRKGDRVEWHFDELDHETHTVTHPVRKALRVVNSEPILCDPNGDDESGGETPADFSEGFPPACPEGSAMEVIISTRFALESGDGVVRGQRDFENSGVGGVLGGSPARGFASYRLRFAKPARKAYRYLCMIHPFMRGRVKVR